MSDVELVVLLDPNGQPCGTAPKHEVHHLDTPLHLAFSCYVFDSQGRVLVTRRALSKIAWPGVWTNSFCGHPAPGEDVVEALRRRARWELGIEISGVELRLPDFRYRAVDAGGIVENEVCPVYTATTSDGVIPRESEVCDFQWVPVSGLATAAAAAPWAFSPWLVLQLKQLELDELQHKDPEP
ncbi:isopentenyl-diphosphate Delta-isomerase [Pseudarthrobacter sp. J75]|uniref:isopentenyl-diphosphate Delta-isomerase n=1 Tax=unclassified Pseudarthrobacter TaxID=2647000 RepID=UPI002E81C835|nr:MULTISPECIES: isopentenyl-diphosphate Delta-isomerase [unclassified Pseudarthrobacter]MEE2521906.1 isopentenyl-diphosphate Delta-isomerase [Pseudarthrobacter sp. J47]MEE2528831.1 isopentenyl-diphosphate Delta-isomerase [Pseudarthrobacter sp. J75]